MRALHGFVNILLFILSVVFSPLLAVVWLSVEMANAGQYVRETILAKRCYYCKAKVLKSQKICLKCTRVNKNYEEFELF